jgi:hypothetical protein
MEKTDLKKILSVSGQHGLFLYLSQARNGVIVESLETKQRTTFGTSAKISSMADISVYTTTEDVSLKEIFTGMAQKLKNGPATRTPYHYTLHTTYCGQIIFVGV